MFREINNAVKRGMKRTKENWIEEQCSEIEYTMNKSNSKRPFQIVNNLTKKRLPKTSSIQDKDGKMLTEENDIRNRWTEYCSDLTTNLISHPSKVMLKVIINRLKPLAENIIAEEQAGFRAGRRTTEQIFNVRILCEKYPQQQENIYHAFIDFKKAFDRVWHSALWATMKNYNIGRNLFMSLNNCIQRPAAWFFSTVP